MRQRFVLRDRNVGFVDVEFFDETGRPTDDPRPPRLVVVDGADGANLLNQRLIVYFHRLHAGHLNPLGG